MTEHVPRSVRIVKAEQFQPITCWPAAIIPYPGTGLKDGQFYGHVETPHGPVWVADGDWVVTTDDGKIHVWESELLALMNQADLRSPTGPEDGT